MNFDKKFTESFEDLKEKISCLGGNWDVSRSDMKVFVLEKGILNWFPSTGTLQLQGKGPGKERIKAQVPDLLWPPSKIFLQDEAVNMSDKFVKESSVVNDVDQPEDLYIRGKFTDAELVIGVVHAVGTEYKRVTDPLKDRLKGFGYEVNEIRISSLLPTPPVGVDEYNRISHYMKEGDELRRQSRNNAIMAAGAASEIKKCRNGFPKKVAYLVNSLKHPDEVELLRRVYGDGLYLFGIHADETRRKSYLMNDKSLSAEQADELIRIDEDEKIDHGQRTRDTFHLADFFLSLGKNDDQVKNTIQRFLDLIFSNPFKNPTFDEFAMFMAFNSSIRSSDLSRQVGAIISKNSQIVSTGANEIPKFGGGQYWAEVNQLTGDVIDNDDGKDYKRKIDSNKSAQGEIINEIVESLLNEGLVLDDKKDYLGTVLRRSKISDLTEFGRVVHAEMEAILSCARLGVSTVGSVLYCTTFPCHNCAKHIIGAGVKRVVYVEPYPKSRALNLHSDSIFFKQNFDGDADGEKVVFEPFTGVGVRRFLDLFSLSLGSGFKLKRKDGLGAVVTWERGGAVARMPLFPKSYIEIEMAVSKIWDSARA